jgi:hypothetical protein
VVTEGYQKLRDSDPQRLNIGEERQRLLLFEVFEERI